MLPNTELKTCINKFYGCIVLRVIFQSARRIKSFFPYKDTITRSQMSKVVYKASCWDCLISTLAERNVDCMTEKLNILIPVMHLLSQTTSRQLEWDHFEIQY